MLDFIVNKNSCTRCGECVRTCPARIISMEDGTPAIAPENEAACYQCQHCLAICPTGAIAILGVKPTSCAPLKGNFPDPDKLELLIKGRRSIRRYRDENLDPALVQRLFDVACHAPTGMNMRQVHFTLIDGKEQVARLRQEVMSSLEKLVAANALPAGMEFLPTLSKHGRKRK